MINRNSTFTSESVCAGHPDKICDQISDAIVDAVLAQDPYGHLGVETMAAHGHIVLAGEVTANAKIDFEKIARDQIKRLGYTDTKSGFSYLSPVAVHIHKQSPEIKVGVDDKGAGDQGMMFGFACVQTPQFMPLPIIMAHELTAKIDEVREKKILPYLRPDGKSQVTIKYNNKLQPVKVLSVVLAVPHKENITLKQVKADLYKHVVTPVLKKYGFKISSKDVIVNGTGIWHHGGPSADSGLTGRKIVVDTYGGYARVGGGAFSGKDPTKVDRSGAYAARFLAKNIVANKLADAAEVRLAYFIGAKKPVMQDVETFGTAKVSSSAIADFMNKILDTSVAGILEALDLRKPLYTKTAAYGHFGRDGFPWEKIINP